MRRCAAVIGLLLLGVVLWAQEGQPDALQEYRNRNFDRAIAITLAELERNPNNIDSYVVLGWSLNALGRYQEAIDNGLRALQINRFESRVIQIIAEAQYNLGNSLQALEYLQRYIQVAPTGSYVDWVYAAMGEIFLRLGEYHRADIALSTSVYHNNRIASRWVRLGFTREQLEDWEHALAAYERALQLDPNLSDAIRGAQRVRSRLQG